MGGGVFTLGILVALGPVVVYLILKNPKNSLYMLVATFPLFNIESVNIGGGFLMLSPHKIFGATVVVLMAVDVIGKGKEFVFLAPHMVLSLLLLVMMLLSFLVNGSTSLSWAQRYLSNLAFLLAMVTWLETREEADRARQVFLASLVIITIITSFGFGEAMVEGLDKGARFESTMLNANRAAQIFLIGIGLSIGWLLRHAETPWRRYVGIGIVSLFVWSLLRTGSRAGLIGLVLISIGALFLLWSRKRTRPLVIPLVIGGVIVYAFMPATMQERAQQIPGVGGLGISQEEARRSRIHQYRLAVDLVDKSPMFGVGPHEFNKIYSQRVEADVNRTLHSWYLKVAVDAGIPGLLLFVLLFLLTLFVGVRGGLSGPDPGIRGEAWSFAFMVGALMVFGAVSSVPYSKLTWLVFALGAVELQLRHRERDKAQIAQAEEFREAAPEQGVRNNTVVVIKKD